MNNCKICQNNKETFNLPVCNHQICKDCSNQHIFGKVVNHNNLDFLQCPICNTYVQIDKIKNYIDEKDYKLINDLIDDRRETFGLGVDDALVKCFKCYEQFLVNKGLQIVKCFNCKQEICKNCNKEVHKNLSCAQNIQLFLQSKENSIQKPLYEEQMKDQQQQQKQDQKQEQKQEKQQYQQMPVNKYQIIYQQSAHNYPIQQQQYNQLYQQTNNINSKAQDDKRIIQQQDNLVIEKDQQQIFIQPEVDYQEKQFNSKNNQENDIKLLEQVQDIEEKDPVTPKFIMKEKKELINEYPQEQYDIQNQNIQTGPLEICIICFDPVGDIKLPICAHPFCRTCLNEYLLEMVIKPKCLDQLMCPNCQTKLEIENVQQHLDKQIFNEISDIILEKGQIYGLGVDDALVNCFKCNACFIVNKMEKVAKCVNCAIEICRKCNKNFHKNMTCEEAFGEESLRFQQLRKSQGWIKCPQCDSTIERVQGCNFMRCGSSRCQKKTYFCYLCKQLLEKEDHYTHYKKSPYGDECLGTQSGASTKANSSEIQQFEKQQQEQVTEQAILNQQIQQHDICIICFDPVGDIQLPICAHPFCRPCLNEYLLNMVIKPKFLDQLMCPYCRTKLEIESVQQHLDKEIFNSISDLILESGQILGLGIDDAFVKCFKCDACFLINKGLQVAKCQNCSTEICRKCNKNSHQDVTCEESAKSNIDEESLKFQQFAQSQGWIKCPKCNQTIDRIKGCNFIRCESSECKRRTYFCFLCKELLTYNDHYKHFYRNNPYNNECIITLKKQKEFLKSTVAPEKKQDQTQAQIRIQQKEQPQQPAQQVQQRQPANQIKYENNFRFTIETPNIQNQNIQYQYIQQQQPQNQYLQKQQLQVQPQIQNQQIQQVYHYDNNQKQSTVAQSFQNQNQNIQYQPVYMQFEQPQQTQKQQPENQEIKIGNQVQSDINQRQTFVNSNQNVQYQIIQQQIQQSNNKYQIVYQQVDVRQYQPPIQQQNFGQQIQINQQKDQQQQNQDKVVPNLQKTLIEIQQNTQSQTYQNKDEKMQGQVQQEQQNNKPKLNIKKIPFVRNIPQNLKSDPIFGPPETEYNQFLLQILTQTCRNCANELEVQESNIRQCQECENKYCNKCFCQIFSDHIC